MSGGSDDNPAEAKIPRSSGRRRASVAAAVAAVVAVATAVAIPVGLTLRDDEAAGEPAVLPPVNLASQLTPFDACPEFLSDLHGWAREQVTPYGFPPSSGMPEAVPSVGFDGGRARAGGTGQLPPGVAAPAPAGDSAAAAAESAPGGPTYSGTNVQVADVDEPDTVKTDGQLLVSVAGYEMRVLDVATPRLRGVLTFAEPVDELLLVGDLAVVFGAKYPYARSAPSLEEPGGFAPPRAVAETTVTVVDLADPDRPRMLRTLSFTGTRVAARVVDGEIRFVLRSGPPSLGWTFPSFGITPEAAVEANRRLVEQTTVDDWLPRYRVEDGGTAPAVEGPLVACEDVLRPQTPGDLSMISVLTVDPEAEEPGRATSVVGGGDTVYAEQTSLYVAGNRYPVPLPAEPIAPPSDVVTQVHQFDVGDPAQAGYVASGEVQGRLLNSYALSAADGRLRVATTRQVGATTDGATTDSFTTDSFTTDNAIVVLEARGQQLTQVGQVGGLGVGEQIYAVRYLGDVAWVVTFRQTDPLYAVDLSDPTRPAVRGELKLPGFSTFLLPLPDDRLLGVGESADASRGTKLALFDVSDLSAPRLLDDEIVAGALPLVSGDPHAFLWWAPTGLAVVPVTASWDGAGSSDQRALAFRTDGGQDTVALTGRLGHVGEPNPVTRAVVVGDQLFAVSAAGVQVHDVADLAPGAWVPW